MYLALTAGSPRPHELAFERRASARHVSWRQALKRRVRQERVGPDQVRSGQSRRGSPLTLVGSGRAACKWGGTRAEP